MIVGFQNQIRGFVLRDLSKFLQIKTCDNPDGVLALQSYEGLVSVASPNIQPGTIHLAKFRNSKVADGAKPLVIQAHQTAITSLAFNRDASVLASTSEQGTLIRLFNTATGEKISELRRGSETASIRHTAFEWATGAYLTCCSDKQTVHIFKCQPIADSMIAS